MPNKFVLKSQPYPVKHALLVQHDCIFEGSTLGKAKLPECFHFMKKAKRPSATYLFFKGLRSYYKTIDLLRTDSWVPVLDCIID